MPNRGRRGRRQCDGGASLLAIGPFHERDGAGATREIELHILGLAQMPADKSTLDAAYKRRIKITRPDRQKKEASTEMTMKLIAARALLIRLCSF